MFLRWLAGQAKPSDTLEAYAHDTARSDASITDKLHRHVRKQDNYTLDISNDTDCIRNVALFASLRQANEEL